MELEFLTRILEKFKNINFMKIRPAGVKLLFADGQTDMQTCRHDEANSYFS